MDVLTSASTPTSNPPLIISGSYETLTTITKDEEVRVVKWVYLAQKKRHVDSEGNCWLQREGGALRWANFDYRTIASHHQSK